MLLYFHSDIVLLLDELLVLLRPVKNDVEDALVDELEEPIDNCDYELPERIKTQPHDDRDNCFLPFDSKKGPLRYDSEQ